MRKIFEYRSLIIYYVSPNCIYTIEIEQKYKLLNNVLEQLQ